MLRGCLANVGAQTDTCLNQMDQTRCNFMYENVHLDPHTNTFTQNVKRSIRPSTLPSLDTIFFLMQNHGSDFTDKRSLEFDFKGKKIRENGHKESLTQTAKMLRDIQSTRGLTQ